MMTVKRLLPILILSLLLGACAGAGEPAVTIPATTEVQLQPARATETPAAAIGATETAQVVETSTPAVTEEAAGEPTEEIALEPTGAPAGESGAPPAFTLFSEEPIIQRTALEDEGLRYIAPGAVIVQDGRFHMFRGGFQSWPGRSEVAHYTSEDGYSWTRQESEPVLRSDDVPYAEPGTMGHSGFVDEDGLWSLYFHTYKGSASPGFIGRATAAEPAGPWTADAEPVLWPGSAGSWDDLRFVRPQVLRTDEGFVMYYAGFDQTGKSMIGMARSPDGVAWTKYDDPSTETAPFSESDPVLQPADVWTDASITRPAVARTPEGWVMLFQSDGDYGMAFSDDGLKWQPYEGNPVLRRRDAPGDGTSLYQAALAYDDGTYFLFVESGGRSGAEIYLLTHEGFLRGEATTGEQEEEEQNPIADAVTVETLVAELPSATGGVTVDREGNVYVGDMGAAPARLGEKVYMITPDGDVSVYVDGEGLKGASGNAFDSQGNLFQSSFSGNTISKITPESEVSVFATDGIRGPVGIAIDGEDNLYVANCRARTIQRVTARGESTLFATDPLFRCPNGITLDDEGNLYVLNFSGGMVVKVTPDGEASALAELPGGQGGHIVYDGNGYLYAVARRDNRIYRITLAGEMTLLAGTGERGAVDGAGGAATFSLPNGIAISPAGDILYVNQVLSLSGTANYPSVVRLIRLPER